MAMYGKKNPALLINLPKIQHNAKIITTMCQQYGIQVAAVTKGFCAIPAVAEAMLLGGCSMLADSRVKNLQKLRETLFDVEYMLLRAPMISEVDEVIRCADISLNADSATIYALNQAARYHRTHHKIILMLDIGDLREGIWPDTLRQTVDDIIRCDHIIFEGIGCNVGCYGGVLPTPENMNFLLHQKELIETAYNLSLKIVSAGSSSGLQLLLSGNLPPGINHFRIGEAILLGRSTTDRFLIPETFQDAFFLRGEIIECHCKPSVPVGVRGMDAFGHHPKFEDRGVRRQAIVALGRQDITGAGELVPLDSNIIILGATSDHLIVDITDSENRYTVGDPLKFSPNYTSLLTAATSEYVTKTLIA